MKRRDFLKVVAGGLVAASPVAAALATPAPAVDPGKLYISFDSVKGMQFSREPFFIPQEMPMFVQEDMELIFDALSYRSSDPERRADQAYALLRVEWAAQALWYDLLPEFFKEGRVLEEPGNFDEETHRYWNEPATWVQTGEHRWRELHDIDECRCWWWDFDKSFKAWLTKGLKMVVPVNWNPDLDPRFRLIRPEVFLHREAYQLTVDFRVKEGTV